MMTTTVSPLSGSPSSSIKNEPAEQPKPVVKKTKIRKRVNSAEKRNQHNAIERARRETLNGKFISLARLLPGLAESKRPSKSAIVNNSISHLNYQREQRLLAAKLLRSVTASHDAMLKELNEWRSRAGFPAKDTTPVWTAEMDEICAVESEVFGVFANEDGEVNDDDDMPNDGAFDAGLTASLSSLITPRSSSDMDALTSGIFLAQQQQQQQVLRGNAAMNGLNWSQDFTFGSLSSSGSSLPFNAFMSDSMDQSSSGSPSNSIQGNVLTPPTMDQHLYTHTPSPQSTHSFGDDNTASWSERQQMLYLQSQAVHQQAPTPVRQQSMPSIPSMTNNNQFNVNASNANAALFNNLFGQHVPQAHTLMAAANNCDPLTQSLLAQMFPSQGVSMEEVSQWRKLALAGMNQSNVAMPTIRPTMLRSNSMWEQPVEGF